MFSTLQAICAPQHQDSRCGKICSPNKAAFLDFAIFVSMVVIGLIGTFNANPSFTLPSTANWLLVGAGIVGLALLAAKKVPSNSPSTQPRYMTPPPRDYTPLSQGQNNLVNYQ